MILSMAVGTAIYEFQSLNIPIFTIFIAYET